MSSERFSAPQAYEEIGVGVGSQVLGGSRQRLFTQCLADFEVERIEGLVDSLQNEGDCRLGAHSCGVAGQPVTGSLDEPHVPGQRLRDQGVNSDPAAGRQPGDHDLAEQVMIECVVVDVIGFEDDPTSEGDIKVFVEKLAIAVQHVGQIGLSN